MTEDGNGISEECHDTEANSVMTKDSNSLWSDDSSGHEMTKDNSVIVLKTAVVVGNFKFKKRVRKMIPLYLNNANEIQAINACVLHVVSYTVGFIH